MYMSGVVTGMALIVAVLRPILLVLLLALAVCVVAVAGATQLRTVAVLIASTALRPAGATSSVFVSPYSKFFPRKKQEKRNKSQLEVISWRWRAEPPQAEK